MSDEKTMYLAQWKDQEKFPDFEPILIEILEKLAQGASIEGGGRIAV